MPDPTPPGGFDEIAPFDIGNPEGDAAVIDAAIAARFAHNNPDFSISGVQVGGRLIRTSGGAPLSGVFSSFGAALPRSPVIRIRGLGGIVRRRFREIYRITRIRRRNV